ncbi:MAG: prolipoprotein diacylglyceryl transferase, partial [Candidatus Auribacterota bacterium]|nr:prolipoprotein diacylglyceryl transferase [Candidatus Auribacterota bacterium]
GGLVVLGGIIASIITVYIYCRVKRLDPFDIADIVAPSLSLGQAIGRLGCFLNGCCWGTPTDLPIGVRFPPRDFMPAGYWGVPLHPVQLYNVFGNLVLFCVLSYVFKRRKVKGEVFAFYLILHTVWRFSMEFLRGDNEKVFAGLTVFQIMSIFLFIAGIIMMAVIRKNKKLKVKSENSY